MLFLAHLRSDHILFRYRETCSLRELQQLIELKRLLQTGCQLRLAAGMGEKGIELFERQATGMS